MVIEFLIFAVVLCGFCLFPVVIFCKSFRALLDDLEEFKKC